MYMVGVYERDVYMWGLWICVSVCCGGLPGQGIGSHMMDEEASISFFLSFFFLQEQSK